MTDVAQLQQWLSEARNAYHRVSIGGAPVMVRDQNGEQIEYSRASPASLLKYIASLEAQINAATGVAVTSGPLRFLF